jgi:hypothetical protein
MQLSPKTQRERAGCLARSFGFLVLGTLCVIALTAIFAPWGFFLGGHFHPLPVWQGWGKMHSAAGDYVLFVQMFPTSGGRRNSLSGPSVRGSGIVCTPRGGRYSLRLTGNFLHNIGLDTNGQQLYLYLSQQLNFLNTNRDTRLRISFSGAWQSLDLVLDDRGTISRAFNSDGTLYTADPRKRPAASETLQVTLHLGTRTAFDSACTAAKSH